MNRDLLLHNYYGASSDSFWLWQDRGESIAWSDGKTIAFAEELAVVLKQLAPYGLPRFGSLLLLIAATRKNWAVDGSEAGQLARILLAHIEHEQSAGAGDNVDSLLKRALAGLHGVRALDSTLRSSLEAKAALAQLVFEDKDPFVTQRDAAFVAEAIRPGLVALIESKPEAVSSGYGATLLLQDLAALLPGLERVRPEAIRLRMETGLTALPLPADLDVQPEELLPCEKARQLINKLIDSTEHAGLARVAKQLLASTTLPRRLTEHHEQEVGGFSDIANRGTPDRLLLSELAQDGLTLAVRIAMNEALYLHRETPPSVPKLRRELLIDSGVRAWGTPRVMTAAAALALVATTPKTTSLEIWRGSGSQLQEVDLTTEDGLIEHLSVLEPDPHLADALPEFSKRIEDSVDPVEAILLMPDEVLEDGEFTQFLRGLDVDHLYLATVSRQGEFRLVERRSRGEKLVRRSSIDLDLLLENEEPLIDVKKSGSLPAIFRVEPFPLLLSHSVTHENSWYLDHLGAMTITGDGRLMRRTELQKGGEQLAVDLPKGKLWWASPTCFQGVTQFVYGSSQSPCWYEVDVVNRRIDKTPLQCESIKGAVFHNDALFCIHADKLSEMDIVTGERTNEVSLPRALKWMGGRCFNDGFGNWHGLAHSGQGATVEEWPGMTNRDDPVVHMWEAEGFEQELWLTRSGRVLYLIENEQGDFSLGKNITQCRVQWTSPDGLFVKLTMVQDRLTKNIGLELRRKEQAVLRRISFGAMDHRIQSLVREVPLRKKFHSIGVNRAGQLVLKSNKQQLIGAVVSQGLPLFSLLPRNQELLHERVFVSEDVGEQRIKLATATWPDGSRATLDSRGLLHLQSSDPTISEITIVLSEGELTCWCDDGQTFGKEYFFDDKSNYLSRTADARKRFNAIIPKFVEVIRAHS